MKTPKKLNKLEIALLRQNDTCISPDEDFTLLYITFKFVILHAVTLKGSKVQSVLLYHLLFPR